MNQPDHQTILVTDLIQDAALVSQECLNSLDPGVQMRVAAALQCGGEIEVRTRLRKEGGQGIAVWLFNKSGQGLELAQHNLPATMG